jgi:hypothetical protein
VTPPSKRRWFVETMLIVANEIPEENRIEEKENKVKFKERQFYLT